MTEHELLNDYNNNLIEIRSALNEILAILRSNPDVLAKSSTDSILDKFPKGIIKDFNTDNLEVKATDFLHRIGLPRNIKGFTYSRAAIILVYTDPNMLSGVTTKLYPTIAREYNTTASKVERAIRHSIKLAYCQGNIKYLNELFGNATTQKKSKPSNSEFIAMAVDTIRIE